MSEPGLYKLHTALGKAIMGNIIVAIFTLPFQAFVSLINFIFFPPKPLTPKEQMLKRLDGAKGQNLRLQNEIIGLQSSLRLRDLVIRDLELQLYEKEAELNQALKQIQRWDFKHP